METYVYHVQTSEPLVWKQRLMGASGEISFFDFRRLICREQLTIAVQRADIAFQKGYNIAKQWGIEVLLELSGLDQIGAAVSLLEVTEDTDLICVLSRGRELEMEGLRGGLPEFHEVDSELLELYGLSGDNPCSEIIVRGASMRV